MRVSALGFWGWGLIGSYTLAVTIYGGIKMTDTGNVKNSAQSGLDDATNKWNRANTDYSNAQSALAAANQKISDASCFVSKYNDFLTQLSAFCSPPATGNAQTDASTFYSVNIVTKPDAVSSSSRSECDWIPVPYTCTKYDSNGKAYSGTCTHLQCFPYTVTTTYTSKYGTTITGSGASYQMNCGQYNHGVVVRSRQYLKSSTGVVADNKYAEHKIDYYASQENVDRIVDAATATSTYEVDPANTNYQAIAASLLSLVAGQCSALTAAIKKPEVYAAIVSATQATIPNLQSEIARTQVIYDNATNYKTAKQHVYDTANGYYQNDLSLWLPLILVVPFVMSVFLCCLQDANDQNPNKTIYDLDAGEPFIFLFKCCERGATTPPTGFKSTIARASQDDIEAGSRPAQYVDNERSTDTVPVYRVSALEAERYPVATPVDDQLGTAESAAPTAPPYVRAAMTRDEPDSQSRSAGYKTDLAMA